MEDLKQENDRLKNALAIWENATQKQTALKVIEVDKYRQTLQEIKAIVEELLEKGLEPQSVEHQLRLKGKRELASIISDLITKAGSEVK